MALGQQICKGEKVPRIYQEPGVDEYLSSKGLVWKPGAPQVSKQWLFPHFEHTQILEEGSTITSEPTFSQREAPYII